MSLGGVCCNGPIKKRFEERRDLCRSHVWAKKVLCQVACSLFEGILQKFLLFFLDPKKRENKVFLFAREWVIKYSRAFWGVWKILKCNLECYDHINHRNLAFCLPGNRYTQVTSVCKILLAARLQPLRKIERNWSFSNFSAACRARVQNFALSY